MTILAWIGLYFVGFLLTWFLSVRLSNPHPGTEGWTMLEKLLPSVIWPGYLFSLLCIALIEIFPYIFFPDRAIKKGIAKWKSK
ncbi:hypothetical protein FDI69_gp207 [Rhodococcus phage Trina]|uniref:Uncharacterized protein n=1 Tax=Rhodococcus phage Trina TaxID=2027905 RepID=A0A2D0ZN36_9CAUD|nr:hypothetical protein FDI69_gp207 [Rhodococcus phage Trina]ASZ74979.1 hypothetical protein SEA_TRINA_200 [Rhodococcus phage Trina]